MTTANKIVDRETLAEEVAQRRVTGQRMVFSNGCFDLLHAGHVRYLAAARAMGDYLVVAVNSDASTERLKGPGRPLLPEDQRARLMASLASVDYIVVFDEDTPIPLLEILKPEILVKGGDYGIDGVVGREVVWEYGGKVETVLLTEGASTTNLIQIVLDRNRPDEN